MSDHERRAGSEPRIPRPKAIRVELSVEEYRRVKILRGYSDASINELVRADLASRYEALGLGDDWPRDGQRQTNGRDAGNARKAR